jgi:hypothetical protein
VEQQQLSIAVEKHQQQQLPNVVERYQQQQLPNVVEKHQVGSWHHRLLHMP